MSSSFTFHYQWFWFGGFTAPVHHYLSLAPGPNSGVHLTISEQEMGVVGCRYSNSGIVPCNLQHFRMGLYWVGLRDGVRHFSDELPVKLSRNPEELAGSVELPDYPNKRSSYEMCRVKPNGNFSCRRFLFTVSRLRNQPSDCWMVKEPESGENGMF